MSDELPENAFHPASGKLGQLIYESPAQNIAPRFELYVEVAFDSFELEDEEVSPILRINSILLDGIKSWRELEGKSYEFPYAPKPGSVEANVFLDLPRDADVTKLEFGAIEDEKIAVKFSASLDLDELDLDTVELELALQLEVSGLRIATSMEKRHKGDENAIRQEAGEVVDLSQYGELGKVPGGMEFVL